MSGSSELNAFLTNDAPAWLTDLFDTLSPRHADNGMVLFVAELSPEAMEALDTDLRAEFEATGEKELAPIILPVAIRVATNPAVAAGLRTGAGYILKGGLLAAGASGWKKMSGWF